MVEDRIKEITEADCDFVESLDTTHPGLIEATRDLVRIANKAVPSIIGENDPILAGEILLLAGYSALLYTQGNKPSNMAVHLKGLILNGEPLPIQSIYVAMKEAVRTNPRKQSPRSAVKVEDRTDETEDSPEKKYKKYDPVPSVESAMDWDIIQAELDAETDPEVLKAAKEYSSGIDRLADKPSMADQPLPERIKYQKQGITAAGQPAGLHGGRD